jgi:hypothetical protein
MYWYKHKGTLKTLKTVVSFEVYVTSLKIKWQVK